MTESILPASTTLSESAPAEDVQDVTVEPEQEFRFETVSSKSKVTLRLLSGTAEIFGSEIIAGTDYTFTGKKLALFTWHGYVTGKCSVAYVGNETPMKSYFNVHLALEQLRHTSKHTSTPAPRVLILGPSDVGKSALSRILLNYASKMGNSPLFVDLDPASGSVAIPGSLASISIPKPMDPQEEFLGHATHMGSTPLVYYFGYFSPEEKPQLYSRLVSSLAKAIEKKMEIPSISGSGIIIDTPSYLVDGAGMPLITQIAEDFKVNVILVIGHERLFSDLNRKYPEGGPVSILKLSKSGGVVTRDKQTRRHEQMQKVREYFYGSSANEMTPFSQTVSMSDIIVRRVGDSKQVTVFYSCGRLNHVIYLIASSIPSSALPLGSTKKEDTLRYVKVEAGDILLNSLLAISSAPLAGAQITLSDGTISTVKTYTPEEETEALLKHNVLGFVYVSEVDEERRKLTILCPQPGRLPNRFTIMGALKWMDM